MARIGVTLGAVFGEESPEAVERAAAAGADVVEFFDWEGKGEQLVAAAEEHGIEAGGTLGSGAAANIDDTDRAAISYPEPDYREEAVADVEHSIEGAADLDLDTLVVTVGQNRDDLADDAQHRAIVSVLREVAPTAESEGVTVVPEPLNTRVDHPGYYLSTSYEGYEIVDAVDSPNVGLLYDVYHQQITEGNVIQNVSEHVEFIDHMHLADVPGRHEPGTGELNYDRIFDAIDEAGYEGYVSCELGPTGDPDEVVEHVVSLAA